MHRNCHHPGAYLQELLIWHQLSAEDLAREIDVPCRAIVDLTSARRGIDATISEGLAGFFVQVNQDDFTAGIDNHISARTPEEKSRLMA